MRRSRRLDRFTRSRAPVRLRRIHRRPGHHPGDTTSLLVTYYNINKPHGELSVFEQFTLHRSVRTH